MVYLDSNAELMFSGVVVPARCVYVVTPVADHGCSCSSCSSVVRVSVHYVNQCSKVSVNIVTMFEFSIKLNV